VVCTFVILRGIETGGPCRTRAGCVFVDDGALPFLLGGPADCFLPDGALTFFLFDGEATSLFDCGRVCFLPDGNPAVLGGFSVLESGTGLLALAMTSTLRPLLTLLSNMQRLRPIQSESLILYPAFTIPVKRPVENQIQVNADGRLPAAFIR
jgi:hypothetical protein